MENAFFQVLGCNEKKLRDRQMKKLRRYLQARSTVGFSENDYLMMWKGLHYCMWMQDKPILQEELCAHITRLIHCFKTPSQAMLFLKVFFETEVREWCGIDQLRLDKFMMFIRNMLTEGLLYLRNDGWKDESIRSFTNALRQSFLDSRKRDVPLGLIMHIADVYRPELLKASDHKLTSPQFLELLSPFMTYVTTSKQYQVMQHVFEQVFLPLALTYTNKAPSKEKETVEDDGQDSDDEVTKTENGDGEFNEDLEDIKNLLDEDDGDIDYLKEMLNDDDVNDREKIEEKSPREHMVEIQELADQLFKMASEADCRTKNRKMIYSMIHRMRSSTPGRHKNMKTEVGGSEISRKLIRRAERGLYKMELGDTQFSKFLKSSKKANTEAKHENDENDVPIDEDVQKASKGNKKRRREISKNVVDTKILHKKKKNEKEINKQVKLKKKKHSGKTNEKISSLDESSCGEAVTEEVRNTEKVPSSKKRKLSVNNKKEKTLKDQTGDNLVSLNKSPSPKSERKKNCLKGSVSEESVDHSVSFNSKGSPSNKKQKLNSGDDPFELSSPPTKILSSLDISKNSPKERKKSTKTVDEFAKPLQDGEIEIFIPSRKWQAKHKDATPKITPREKKQLAQTPKPRRRLSVLQQEKLSQSEPRKRVRFDPSKNKALDFKDSLKLSASPVFPQCLSPSHGILKPATPLVGKRNSKKSL